MPLPDNPLTVNGGCSCGAIRYKISIPEICKRPLHPYSASSADAVHLPMVAIDHCNDCRRATGALLPFWICAPTAFVTSSLAPRSNTPKLSSTSQGPWHPASEIFVAGAPAASDSFLGRYCSSELRTRYFCNRCGTHLAYNVIPMPEGWPDMLDILLGTVDREDLDGKALQPERHVWWDCGINWVKDLATKGAESLPIHGTSNVREDVS